MNKSQKEVVLDRNRKVVDWSKCRSPSRAKRRMKRGFKQHVTYYDDPDVLWKGGQYFAHPDAWEVFTFVREYNSQKTFYDFPLSERSPRMPKPDIPSRSFYAEGGVKISIDPECYERLKSLHAELRSFNQGPQTIILTDLSYDDYGDMMIATWKRDRRIIEVHETAFGKPQFIINSESDEYQETVFDRSRIEELKKVYYGR